MRKLLIFVLALLLTTPAKKSYYTVHVALEAVSESMPTLRAVGAENVDILLVNGADTLRHHVDRADEGYIYFKGLDVGSECELIVRREDYPEYKEIVTVLKQPVYHCVVLKNGSPIIVK